jgi:methionyl-tRNA formyltransferase
VVVLSCGSLGCEVAAELYRLPGVARVTAVSTPYRQPRRSMWGKVRHVHRMQGWPGLCAVLASRLGLRHPGPADKPADPDSCPAAGVPHLRFEDFHDADCLAALRALKADLGVVAGTYILREEVFSIPRLGCINLHSGKVPDYRGAAPGFWELYNGERQVGITIHRVTARVDAGAILLQEVFPLDPAPPGDPLAYVEEYRRAVLRPNGVRLLARAVAAIADGSITDRPQDSTPARTYRSPDYRAVKELRRRVRARRRAPDKGSPGEAGAGHGRVPAAAAEHGRDRALPPRG